MCDSYDGRHFVLPFAEDLTPLRLQVGTVEMLDMESQPLADGDYQMVLSLETNPQTRAGFVFSWPVAEQEVPMEQSAEVIVEQQSRLLTGTWSGLQTELGTCWMFESLEEGQLLLSSAIVGSQWAPQQGWSGTYEVTDSPAHPACANFQAPSFQIREVMIESPLETVETPTEPAQTEASVTPQEQVVSYVPLSLIHI